MIYFHVYLFVFCLLPFSSHGNISRQTISRLLGKNIGKLDVNQKNGTSNFDGIFGFQNLTKYSIFKLSKKFLSDSQMQCLDDIKFVLQHVNSEWSIQMLDASAKVPSGTLLGNFLWMGKYQECMNVHFQSRNDSHHDVNGLYCVATWNITVPNKFRMPLQHIPVKTGVCLPDSCGVLSIEKDIKQLIILLHRVPFLNQYGGFLSLNSLKCKIEDTSINSSTSTFLVCLCLYLSFVILGSLLTIIQHVKYVILQAASYKFCRIKETTQNSKKIRDFEDNEESSSSIRCEIYKVDEYSVNDNVLLSSGEKKYYHCRSFQKCLGKVLKFLKNFCVFTNSGKILDIRASKNFSCIHGIRFLSMAWVVLGHTYIHNTNIIGNYVDFLHGVDSLPFQVITQGTFSVDSFFLISGFLLSYLYLEKADKTNESINWIGLCIHRFIRITPVYMLLIAYNTLIFKYTGNGPFWEEESDVSVCKQYWWWNLLYINNFLPLELMCTTWTWYLANDMQFFVVGTLLLYVLWRWRKIGVSLCCSILVGSWVIAWCISYYYNLTPLFWGISKATDYEKYKDRLVLTWNVLYSKPYCRIGPYIIGILLAYIMYNKRNENKSLNSWTQALGWTTSSVCCLSVIYGVYHINPNPYLFHFYNALSRSCFSLGVAWVIYCCLSGKGRIVNQLLSIDLWVPLSRLTYCAYLFHPLIMSWYFESQKIPFYFTHINMIMLYFAFMVVSYSAALIISAIFETPIINLEKIFIDRMQKRFKR